MKSMLAKWTSLVLTVILLSTVLTTAAIAENGNLLAERNPGFENAGTPVGVEELGIRSTTAHSGNYSLALYNAQPETYGYIKFPWFPVKPQTNYTLSFWMQNSKADAIKFWAANNAFLKDGNKKDSNGAAYGSLPDMTFGTEREGDAVNVWREVRVNFKTPANINMMNIAINANAADTALLIDDISLTENKNLLADLNPGFENAGTPAGVQELGLRSTTANFGNYSLDLYNPDAATDAEKYGYIKFLGTPVKALTNYTLSFWIQNSMADAIKFWAANNKFYINGVANSSYTLPEITFGEAHTGDDINVWREVRMNFTSPANATALNIAINANAADEALKIDDISLVETGKDFGVITNGDFEANILPGQIGGNTGAYTINTEPETGNKYITPSKGYVDFGYALSAVTGKRFKISFKTKSSTVQQPSMRFYKNNNSPFWEYQNGGNGAPFLDSDVNTWETYSLYINATAGNNGGEDLTSGLWIYSPNIDDVYIGEDKNDLGFYQSLTFKYKEGVRHFSPAYVEETSLWKNSFTTEKGVKANTLSEITAVEGVKTVMTRAHVIPTETEAGTFNKETVTLLTAVYKYDKDGNKCLVTVNIATDASSDGKVLDAVGTVQVPENTQDATYKVEAVAWNSVDGMKALFEKRVLEN